MPPRKTPAAIAIRPGVTGTTISNVGFSNMVGDGVRDGGHSTTITGCKAIGNGRHGFNLGAGANTRVSDSIAVNNGGDGFHIRQVPDELRTAVNEAVVKGASGEEIRKTFGDRLRGYGVVVDKLVGVAANSSAIYEFLASLAPA